MSRFRNITTALVATALAVPAMAYDIQMPGNDTKLSVYGFVYALGQYYGDVAERGGTGSLVPGSNGSAEQGVMEFSIKPSRWGFASVTPNSTFGDITTKIEYDLNVGSGAAAHMRHAFATVGNLTFGHTWSLWNDLDASIDEVDWAGPVGSACWDTPRRPQLRYTFPIDKQNTFAIGLEQTTGLMDGDLAIAAPAGYTAGAKTPNLVAAYTYADSWGHLAARVLETNHAVYLPSVAGVKGKDYSKYGTAVMLSGDVKFGKDDLVFNVYNGQGLGDYGYGFQASQFVGGTSNTWYLVKNTGYGAGYTHVFSPMWRGNIAVSGVSFSSDTDTPQLAGATDGTHGAAIKTQIDYIINAFMTINPKTQLGIEYFYETQKQFGSAGTILQNDGSTKNSLTAGKLEVVLQAKF